MRVDLLHRRHRPASGSQPALFPARAIKQAPRLEELLASFSSDTDQPARASRAPQQVITPRKWLTKRPAASSRLPINHKEPEDTVTADTRLVTVAISWCVTWLQTHRFIILSFNNRYLWPYFFGADMQIYYYAFKSKAACRGAEDYLLAAK